MSYELSMNKLDAIRSFVEVANAGSFTQAAEKLGINRIKITRHIKEIEEWLNQRLLHRTTRSVSLTPPGQDALIRCERILNEVAGLESQARSHNEELLGTIRIATPIGLGQHLLFVRRKELIYLDCLELSGVCFICVGNVTGYLRKQNF